MRFESNYVQFLVPGLLYILIPMGLLLLQFYNILGIAIIISAIAGSFGAWYHWRATYLAKFGCPRGKIAHDFRVFFMGHKGSIEAKYTTNKGMLPEALIDEMREAFKRSEEFLDLEIREEDPLLKQREEVQNVVIQATPEQLGKMLEMFQMMGVGKIIQASSV